MFFISEAYAQVATTAAGTTTDNPIMNLLPLILIFAVFYVFLIRPQQKKMKEHQQLVSAVKRGDEVLTSGGILGKVNKVEENSNIIYVEISDNVVVRLNKVSIVEVITDNKEKALVEKSGASSKKEGNSKKAKASK